MLENRSFSLEKIHIDNNASDVMTKTLHVTKMIYMHKEGEHGGTSPFHLSRAMEIARVGLLLK